MMSNKILDGILGFVAGDALGVPVEFFGRAALEENPITGMKGFGSHHQPPGTWSDDTSLTLCLMDSLSNGIDYKDIMKRFILWYEKGEYSPHGELFDIGIATEGAL